jgi:hypothetical protein
MTYLYNAIFYGCNLLNFLLICFFAFMQFLKFWDFLSIESLLYIKFFILYNTHDLSFQFYLYSVRDENTFHFEEFEKSFFVFCLL